MNADGFNALALVAALSLATLGALWIDPTSGLRSMEAIKKDYFAEPPSVVSDARGGKVPVGVYPRIASLNTVADHILLQLVEPERLVAVTKHTREEHPEGWRFGGRVGLPDSRDTEAVLAVQPDLVIASKFSDEAYMARLREAGIRVFDLGDMRGIATTRENILTLGRLLAVEERAARLRDAFDRRAAALEAAVDDEEKPSGLYLTVVGDAWFGGTAGSSHADVLRLAGVRDLAAEHGYRNWPQYSPEQLLAMEPNLVITREGMGDILCAHEALDRLPACGPQGMIVEIDSAYDSDPGLGLLEAAARTQALIHPRVGRGDS